MTKPDGHLRKMGQAEATCPQSSPLPAEQPCRRGRPKLVPDDVQRDRIAEEARRLFLAHGYGRTTMDEVAAACRMSKRTLYRLFPGKLELFSAVVEAHRRSMLALPGCYEHLSLEEALAAIFHADISPEDDRERVAVLRLVLVEARQFPELGDVLRRQGGDPSRSELARWLAVQQEAGRLCVDDAEAMARLLMDMIFGAVLFKADGEVDWPGGAARGAHVRRCIRVFLHGVAPKQAPPG
ncbi:TetR/AcrR family transcriptional regulator [Xanthobacter sp. TB0139]|uniref:TetR/AcrR family transcriptional regulator n=1 Tax=Xanthobacter sp. TB0139 TaxID=3459178 RepID=UPI00403A7274